jgi:antitoxin component YwqK of YwqJK toxin-antitoxin module
MLEGTAIMKFAGKAILTMWAITLGLYLWVEYYLTGDEAFGVGLGVALFWLPVVAGATLLYAIAFLVGKFYRREFKFLLVVPAALLIAVLTGTVAYRDGQIVTSLFGTETRFNLASNRPSTSYSYQRQTNVPDHWLNIREIYEQNGERHREDGPAFNWYYDDNRPSSQEWYVHGIKHRDDGPAKITYYPLGTLKSEKWYINGSLYRENGPAQIEYFPDGTVESEYWRPSGVRFDADLPSRILYYSSGVVEREIWHGDETSWHRINGPAVVYYFETGVIKRELWMINNKLHRDDGPAEVIYDEAGNVVEQYWYTNGDKVASTS